ncbi:conjugal transfer protein TraW [Candidatus Neptunochlamydia vexilliferae]|nr:conjugal transfer protein TraW [Candidatus Neptunochlamydia vexilliferae]
MKQKNQIPSFFLGIALTVLGASLEAKDFETLGQTFPIKEESLKEVLQTKAKKISQTEIEKQMELLGETVKKEGRVFKKIPWIKEADHYHAFFYDPSATLQEDITDAEGKILFSKGTKINPLEHVTLDEGLLFFDGENPKHIKWAESQTGEFKWILIGGDPLKLQEEKKRPVFFDQGGFYSKKFQIEKIPCRITQAGEKLLIEEIPIQKGSR